MPARIALDLDRIAAFCRRNHIRRLALFGSVLRDDFTPHSDVDFLVEFEPHAPVGLIRKAGMQLELAEIVGREVDFKTPGDLSRHFRADALRDAEVIYEQT